MNVVFMLNWIIFILFMVVIDKIICIDLNFIIGEYVLLKWMLGIWDYFFVINFVL